MPLDKSPLARFISDNHNTVMEYHKRHYKAVTLFDKTPYGKVKSLLMSALIASGGRPPLNQMQECLENFTEKTGTLKKRKAFTFTDFAQGFNQNFNEPQDLDILNRELRTLRQIGPKKANLFLKELVLLGGKDIFGSQFNPEAFKLYLRVPIDRVLRKFYCKLYELDFPENNEQTHDKEINKFAEKLFPKSPILFDDMWFWGHFTFVKEEFQPINEALLYCDPLMDTDFITKNELKKKLKRFHKIVMEFDPNQYQ